MIELSDLESKLIKYDLKLQKKSDYYRKILVDEIYFTNELYNLHYGDCAIIGKVQLNSNNEKYLENIRLKCLGSNHSIPEGSIQIRVLDNLFYGYLPHGKSIEIFGRIVLYDKQNPVNNRCPIDVKDIIIRLINFLENNCTSVEDSFDCNELKSVFNINIKKQYGPAIQMRFFNLIDQAEELIECNLHLRMLDNL